MLIISASGRYVFSKGSFQTVDCFSTKELRISFLGVSVGEEEDGDDEYDQDDGDDGDDDHDANRLIGKE